MASPATPAAQDHPRPPSARRARRPSAHQAGCIRPPSAGTCVAAKKLPIADRVALERRTARACPSNTKSAAKLETAVAFGPVVAHCQNFAVAHVVDLDCLAINMRKGVA